MTAPEQEPEWLHKMKTGQMQMGPGQPLLPPTYRGGDDWMPIKRIHVVSRGEELIAGFDKRGDAEKWAAWAAVERGVPLDELVIRTVTLMAVRRAGPLFDTEQGPSGSTGSTS